MKIVYVIDSLASKGGAERILSEKMNYLSEIFNYDVSVITCYQNPLETPNAYFLSKRVTQIDLNISYYKQYHYKYPKRLWVKYSIYRKLKDELTNLLNTIGPDILIGLGYFIADVISCYKGKAVKIIESHEARIFTLSNYGLHRSILSKAYMNVYRYYYLRKVEQNADIIITLTQGDAKEWEKAKRVEIIPDFTLMKPQNASYNINSKRIISVGRLEWQKGFDRLIRIWKIVNDIHPAWELVIFGSGTLEQDLKYDIQNNGVKNIFIYPYTQNISHEYLQSSIFVLASRFEGFSLVLLEAQQHGLPCVAYDCPFGPSDVIDNDRCGFVIENDNSILFAEKICELIESPELRVLFSKEAIINASRFDKDKIMNQWKELFESIIINNNIKIPMPGTRS